ncbi:MAG: histidine--tRNA ligase [Clostridia bacterium]|nr:histidine--tRNA ligase [Clostridia bacterium]
MGNIITAIRGTQDVLPSDSYRWQYIEKTLLETAALYGYKELRVPVFEQTNLFQRSVGDTTDVVQKEMYTFEDKGGRSITLRPEGTAGAVRCLLEHGLYNEALPVKACYVLSCYRYEKPQAGRLREFHQFGVECFGAPTAAADAEVIAVGHQAFKRLGVTGLQLEINSIGCPECRKKYLAVLRNYFEEHKETLCETCRGRLERNPMRILDCKSPVCADIAKDAPKMLDYICQECKDHFDGVTARLDAIGVPYVINPTIVRGLDYYTRTVFEFVSTQIGAQGTVCAGGRYDGLVEEMGGPSLPSLGFAMGLERLLLLMDAQNLPFPADRKPDLYVVPMGEAAAVAAAKYCEQLREEGFVALTDLNGRGLKAQMKYANKIGASYTIVIGEDELAKGKVNVKNMENGQQTEISLENIVKDFYAVTMETALANMEASVENLGK